MPFGNHEFVFYASESISSLYIDLFVLSLDSMCKWYHMSFSLTFFTKNNIL